MRIAVVAYKNITENDVRSDLDTIITKGELTEVMLGKSVYEDLTAVNDVIFVDTSKTLRPYISIKLQELKPDLLITYDLAGFELTTLTDGLSYNLLDCRQFHILSQGRDMLRQYRDKVFSLNMLFFDKGLNHIEM